MKKIIYAFLSCCVCQNAFADSPSGVYQNQHVNSILIPRIILQNVLIQDDLISQTPGAVEKMMAKYDQLAGPLGQEPLTVNDITQICASSDVITKKDDCLNHVFNPVLAQMGKVRFMNACSGRITGGNPHCVDDVFVEGKKQNANQYHQDVNVGPYAANGFAIEYAKKKGHDVWCSSEVKDGTVNCTTLDNKEFYSVKFKGTNNTTDTTIEKNLVKGICALFDSKYAIGTFRHQCKMDCAPGSKAREVIQKFGLNVHDGYTKDMHCEIYQPTYTAKDVKTYPGYEYMSRTFKNVQSVLDSSLVEVLKTYVQLQGINVQSFDCEFSPRKYSDEMSNGIPASLDDMLRCHLNGTDVDFIFDDLFEGKEYERKAGQAALQCVLAGGSYGTDRICSGLGKAKCLSPEVQSMIPGGTRWDSKAEVCLLNRAENARTISNALQVGGGIALAIVFTPTGMPFVGLAAVGASVALDAAFIGVERLNILEPASRARQFATDAQKCEIPIGSKHPSCSQQQVDCAWRVVNQHFARLDEVLDRLNPDQLSLVSDLMENTTDCLSNDLLSSAVKMSTPNAWDKALNKANAFLLVAGIFIQPEKGVMRITENAPKVARILSRCKMVERASAQVDGIKYLRIFVDNLDGPEDVKFLANEFRNNGAYVSTKLYKAEDGTHFMAVAEKDIFSKLDDIVEVGKSASQELKTMSYIQSELDDFIKTGKNSTFSKWTFSDDDIANINRELAANNKGVKLSRTEDGSVTFVRDVAKTTSNLESEINEFVRYLTDRVGYNVNEQFASNLRQIELKWGIQSNGRTWEQRIRLYEEKIDDISTVFSHSPDSPKVGELWKTFEAERKIVENAIEEYRGLLKKLENQIGYKVDMFAGDLEQISVKWNLNLDYRDTIDQRIRYLEDRITDIDTTFRQTSIEGIDDLLSNFRKEKEIVEEAVKKYRNLVSDLENAGYRVDMASGVLPSDQLLLKWGIQWEGLSMEQVIKLYEEKIANFSNIVESFDNSGGMSIHFITQFSLEKKWINSILNDHKLLVNRVGWNGLSYKISSPLARDFEQIKLKWGLRQDFDGLDINKKISYLEEMLLHADSAFRDWRTNELFKNAEWVKNYEAERKIVEETIERYRRSIY